MASFSFSDDYKRPRGKSSRNMKQKPIPLFRSCPH